MSIVVRAFPVAGSIEKVRAFASELLSRRAQAADFHATGIDATREPLGPPATLLYDRTDERQPELCDMMKTAVLA